LVGPNEHNWETPGLLHYYGGVLLIPWNGVFRTLLAGKNGLEQAKKLVVAYKQGEIQSMTPELWKAKKIVDATLHPGTEND
jgi:hypothetical protein